MRISFEKTGRGFVVGTFHDRYGQECQIQESSLATEAAIWLGVYRGLAHDGRGDALEEEPSSKRMHLTVDQARVLVTVLNKFIETGSLQHFSK